MGDDNATSTRFCVMSLDGKSVGYVSEDALTVSSDGEPIATFRDSFSDSVTLELKQADFSKLDEIIRASKVTAFTYSRASPQTRSQLLWDYAHERGGKFLRNYMKALRRSIRNSSAKLAAGGVTEPTAWCP